MTVYLVTSGRYSDYSVEGVFSTEEKAKSYLAYLEAKGTEDLEIDSRELDSIEEMVFGNN